MPLPRSFYERSPRRVARDLLGCVLVSRAGGRLTAGRIVETEAYLGPEDEASHAAFRPGSHALFYGPGGVAYDFRAYGLHWCLNAIAGRRDQPGCVLIRALEPVAGLAIMARRRGIAAGATRLASGPGNVTRALGVTGRDSGADLTQGRLVIEPPRAPRALPVACGPRVGIRRAVTAPLRFWLAGSPFVSRRAPSGLERVPRHLAPERGRAAEGLRGLSRDRRDGARSAEEREIRRGDRPSTGGAKSSKRLIFLPEV